MDNISAFLSTQKPKGIIFDFDGVIVDSEDHWSSVENPYIKSHTEGWHDKFYDRLTGMGLTEIHKLLKDEYGFSLTKDEYFNDYEQLALKLYTDIAKPIEGVGDLLRRVRECGLDISIASSSKPTWINISLEKYDLKHYFSHVISSHDNGIKHGKPFPDVYVEALRQSNLKPSEVIAVEDSTNGIKAAKSAGMFCIALNVNGTNPQDISEADGIITTYEDLAKLLSQYAD
jgi:HAD superfamily hydrolase (TIGR01509 family)